jgi:RyR domain
MRLTTEQVASIAHEANRRVRHLLKEDPVPAWDHTSQDIQQSVVNGVRYRLQHPDATDAENHDNWVKFKTEQGWKLGAREDRSAKIHPNLVPYDELPEEQKIKDALFASVVRGLSDYVSETKSASG